MLTIDFVNLKKSLVGWRAVSLTSSHASAAMILARKGIASRRKLPQT